jgi:hypothetical protein
MDGIIENILNFGTSFFILEDVDVSNEGLKKDFCLYNHALFAMFIFFKFLKMITLLLNYMVVLVLMSNLGVWCVLLIYVCCGVLLLMEKGNGELVVGFMNVVAMGMQIWW